jgi:hypothetical protein
VCSDSSLLRRVGDGSVFEHLLAGALLNHQVDPVPGGSANDYDYSAQDPVNVFDMPGFMGTAEGQELLSKNSCCSSRLWT